VSARVAYSATLNMRRETVLFLSSLLHAERRRRGTRKGRRSLGCFTRAVLILRWFIDGTRITQLRGLARDLGVRLLEADGRRVRLTPAAYTVLDHADTLFAQWERARADLAAHRRGVSDEVRFAAVSSALAALVVPAAARLRAEHPGLAVRMAEQESEKVFALLPAHRTDIAVVIPTADGPPPDDPRFDQRALLEEPQDPLVPPAHPLAGDGTAELAAAACDPWIGSPGRADQHHLMLTACAAAGFTPRIAHHRRLALAWAQRASRSPTGSTATWCPAHGNARGRSSTPPTVRAKQADDRRADLVLTQRTGIPLLPAETAVGGKIFTIFEGTSEIQRLVIGRTVRGLAGPVAAPRVTGIAWCSGSGWEACRPAFGEGPSVSVVSRSFPARCRVRADRLNQPNTRRWISRR
jgi:DNA-binding transcriptional LysR family regulator